MKVGDFFGACRPDSGSCMAEVTGVDGSRFSIRYLDGPKKGKTYSCLFDPTATLPVFETQDEMARYFETKGG